MAKDPRKALDDKTAKLSRGGQIKTGKEHEAYQESQQQLLAIQAEQKQNLAVARAESKASFENNQTLMQAAELGAISAAEAEQSALSGDIGGQQLNPATQAVLAKYGMGQPKFVKTQSHSQQVTKQNITINNNTNVSTTNDVKVPANIGGPLQGRPLQFKSPATKGDSTGKFKAWISSAFARQNEEGAKRDREYRNRESSLTRSANKMMKKLEDIGKTIGSRMDPRKIGSTWQSQLKTLLFLFGFGYLTSNWTKILGRVAGIESWVKKTWEYFTNGGFSSSVSELFGGKPGQSIFESLKALFLGNEEEKGLFGHIKQFFQDMWEERAEAVKLVKTPEITNALNDPMTAIKSLFEYLSNILTAAFSGTEGIKKIRLEEAGEKVTKKAEENRARNSTTDNIVKRTVNGEKVDVELGTSAFKKTGYKGISHHMLEGDELTSKFGAESSVAQMSEISRLRDVAKTTGVYHTDDIAINLGRLSRYAGKQGMIPVNKSDISDILSPEEAEKLIASGDLKRNVVYKEIIRPKNDEDYTRNLYGNNGTDPKISALVNYGVNTIGAESFGGALGQFRSWGTKMRTNGIFKGTVEHFLGDDQGTAYGAADLMSKVDEKVKEGKAKYRIEYVREDSPLKTGEFATGNVEIFDEISKEGIRALARGILSKDNKNFSEDTRVDLDDLTGYTKLLKEAALSQREGYIERRNKEIQKELNNLTGNIISPIPLKPEEATPFILGNYNWKESEMFNNIDKATSDRITKLKREYDIINSPRFRTAKGPSGNVQVGLESEMADVLELEERNKARDQKRQEDWENSAAGRSANAIRSRFDFFGGSDIGEYLSEAPIMKQKDNHGAAGMAKTYDSKNPGNYKGTMFSNGQRDSFHKGVGHDHAKFNTWEEGYAGNAWQLLLYLTGKSSHTDKNPTLRKVVQTWVGPHVTEDQLKNYAKDSGLPLDAPLKANADTLNRLVLTIGKWDSAHKVNEEAKTGVAIALNEWKKKGYSTDDDNGNLYNVSVPAGSYSSGTTKTEEEQSEEKSFLEILKDKVTQLITSFGTAFSGTVNKVQEVNKSINEVVKKNFITDGAYEGAITKEFLDYNDYLKDHGTLPVGLNYSQWKNEVYDITGKFPDRLELREDTKKTLSKFEKGGESEEKSEVEPEEAVKPDEAKATEISSENSLRITDITNAVLKKDEPLKILTGKVDDILICLNGANKLNTIIAKTTADGTAATIEGNQIAANSTRQMIGAVNASNQNAVEQTSSLTNDKIITEGVLNYG